MAATCPEPKPVFIALVLAGSAMGQALAMVFWRVLVHATGGTAMGSRGIELWVAGGTLGLAAGFGLAYAVSRGITRHAWARLALFGLFFAAAHRSAVWIWYILAIPNYGVPWWYWKGLLASTALAAVPVVALTILSRFEWRFWPSLLAQVLAGVIVGLLSAALMDPILPTGAPWQFSDTWFDMPISWAFIFAGLFVAERVARKLDRHVPQ